MVKEKKQKGFSLVEALLAVALFGLFASSIVGLIIYSQQTLALSGQQARALFLAQEGLEATRNIRDESFLNLPDGVFGIQKQNGIWIFSGNSDNPDIFTRQITVSSISTSTKEIISTVSWVKNSQQTSSVSLYSRLTNWRLN